MNKSTKSKENRPSLRNAGFLIVALLIIIALLLLVRGCETENPLVPPAETDRGPSIVYDNSATEGGWTEADTDEIIASLNEKVEEGMINISMNTSPQFTDGSAAGNLMIVNESVNRYPQVVEITRNDTNEMIYKSGAIPVGSKIESAPLNTDLAAGSYECTAMFYNVDPETGSYLGCAGAIIHITVLS